jgi:hypothetical protein
MEFAVLAVVVLLIATTWLVYRLALAAREVRR